MILKMVATTKRPILQCLSILREHIQLQRIFTEASFNSQHNIIIYTDKDFPHEELVVQ